MRVLIVSRLSREIRYPVAQSPLAANTAASLASGPCAAR